MQVLHQHSTDDLHGLARRTDLYCVDLYYTRIGTDFAVASTARGFVHSRSHAGARQAGPFARSSQSSPRLWLLQHSRQLVVLPPAHCLVSQHSGLRRSLDAQLEHPSC
jgi:hypothetical protein